MSKVCLLIKEAKIVNTEYTSPQKQYDPKTQEFKCFNFNIVPTISIKKPKSEEWDTKMLAIRCTIWNEKVAEKFINAFDSNSKNYITILDGNLTNFHIEELDKVSQNGSEYKLSAYTYLNMIVNDFVITYKEIDEERESIKKDNVQQSTKPKENNEEELLDDDIPF